MSKTEYRIIPCNTIFGDMYLQFKCIEEKNKLFGGTEKKEVWRFVPNEGVVYVLGYFQHKEECPTTLQYHQESDFKSCFYEREYFKLIPFTKQYEDIEDYFIYLRKKHIEYLDDTKRKQENAKPIYL